MANTNIAKLMAMGVAASTFLTPAVAHADVVISDNAPMSTSQKTGNGASVTLEDGKTNDLANPGGADVSDGPKITVKRDKFLIEKGAAFDFKNSLGLSVVDAKDGDLTSKFQFPALDTSQAKSFTKTITAKNSEGKTSTKTLVFRIIDVVNSIDVESKEALQTMDLSKVISGDTEGLTVKLGAIKDDSFVAKISDGTNTIEKEIKFTVKQSSTGKPSDQDAANPEGTTPEGENSTPLGDGSTTTGGTTSTDGSATTGGTTSTDGSTTTGGSSANPEALPQTGVATTTAGIAAGIAAISGAILKKRK